MAVVGGAASAFDAAGVALEAGAASVDLFARRPVLASVPVARVRGYPGAYDNYPELPDAVRWHQAIRFRRAGSTPPADAIARVLRFANFRLHLAAPWLSAREEDGRIVAQAADGEFRFDFAIAGTGYFVDPGARPELAGFAAEILLWRDRFTPPPDEEDEYLGAHPYLGVAHEYLEKTPGNGALSEGHPRPEPGRLCQLRRAGRRRAEHEARPPRGHPAHQPRLVLRRFPRPRRAPDLRHRPRIPRGSLRLGGVASD